MIDLEKAREVAKGSGAIPISTVLLEACDEIAELRSLMIKARAWAEADFKAPSFMKAEHAWDDDDRENAQRAQDLGVAFRAALCGEGRAKGGKHAPG